MYTAPPTGFYVPVHIPPPKFDTQTPPPVPIPFVDRNKERYDERDRDSSYSSGRRDRASSSSGRYRKEDHSRSSSRPPSTSSSSHCQRSSSSSRSHYPDRDSSYRRDSHRDRDRKYDDRRRREPSRERSSSSKRARLPDGKPQEASDPPSRKSSKPNTERDILLANWRKFYCETAEDINKRLEELWETTTKTDRWIRSSPAELYYQRNGVRT